jgi:predicted cupin superfamily sugar epimerase
VACFVAPGFEFEDFELAGDMVLPVELPLVGRGMRHE